MQPAPIQIGQFDPPPIRSSTAAYNKRDQVILKAQLMDRLYDEGVSNRKMPGIAHLNADHMRPFTAKLTSRLDRQNMRPGTSSQVKLQPLIPPMNIQELMPGDFLEDIPASAEGIPRDIPFGGIPRPNTIQYSRQKTKRKKMGIATIVKSITGVTVFFLPNAY